MRQLKQIVNSILGVIIIIFIIGGSIGFGIYVYIDIKEIKEIIEWIHRNIPGIIFSIIIISILVVTLHNIFTKIRFKRETNGNDKKYIAQRCYEDGLGHDKDGNFIELKTKEEEIEEEIKTKKETKINIKETVETKEIFDINKNDNNEDNRDYFYLVDKDGKKFHRIVDTHTLTKLGYPRPSRRPEKCFKLSDKKEIGKEIKIYNLNLISVITGIYEDFKNK